jgi:hypothetical protein
MKRPSLSNQAIKPFLVRVVNVMLLIPVPTPPIAGIRQIIQVRVYTFTI